MYGSEGSHSSTLMYCSKGSHSGTYVTLITRGSSYFSLREYILPCVIVTYALGGGGRLVAWHAKSVAHFRLPGGMRICFRCHFSRNGIYIFLEEPHYNCEPEEEKTRGRRGREKWKPRRKLEKEFWRSCLEKQKYTGQIMPKRMKCIRHSCGKWKCNR